MALVRFSDTLLRIDWRSAWIPSSSASLSSHTGARGLGRRGEGGEKEKEKEGGRGEREEKEEGEKGKGRREGRKGKEEQDQIRAGEERRIAPSHIP